MEAAPRWAANVAKVAGAMLWAMGTFLHLGILTTVNSILHSVASGWRLGAIMTSWEGMLFLFLSIFSGPIAVAVGGGLRFLGGMMSGHKVAGEQAPRIMLFEWLRYELFALGAAALFGSMFVFADGNSNRPILCIILFFGSILVGGVALWGASRSGAKSKDLMWQLREQGIRRGQVPYPADAIPPKHPLGFLHREDDPR